jgi:hypothetical protein
VRSFLVNSVDKLAVHVELKLSGSCIADRLIIALRKSGFPAPVEMSLTLRGFAERDAREPGLCRAKWTVGGKNPRQSRGTSHEARRRARQGTGGLAPRRCRGGARRRLSRATLTTPLENKCSRFNHSVADRPPHGPRGGRAPFDRGRPSEGGDAEVPRRDLEFLKRPSPGGNFAFGF